MNYLVIIVSLSGCFGTVGILLYSIHKMRRRGRYAPFTEKNLRLPGHTLSIEVRDIVFDFLFWLLAGMFTPIVGALSYLVVGSKNGLILFLVFSPPAVWFFWKAFKLFKEGKIKDLGCDGERYTGQELNYLMRSGAWVYHDLPYQYGNIDHMVVSTGGVFVVETKAVSKPQVGKGKKREAKVECKNGVLHFPHISTSLPLKQAGIHAKYVEQYLQKQTGLRVPVKAVVALPGWFIEGKGGDVMVINPKRGFALQKLVAKNVISDAGAERVAETIEEVARTVGYSTDKTDPDGGEKYDWLLNKKHQEIRM